MSALTGIRVVELAGSVAGEYCGKLLADFGAEVIKIEAPGCGSPTRAMAPILGDDAGCERSALFAYLNTNKRSVALDVTSAAGVERLHELIATADAVVEDRATPAGLGRQATPERGLLLDHPLRPRRGRRVRKRQEPQRVPRQRLGISHPQPCRSCQPPLQGPGRFLADYEAGLEAALCVASSLFGRLHSGRGEFIDISQQAVLVSRADCILGRFITGEVDGRRPSASDYDQAGPAAFFACADGFVYLYMTSRAHWLGLKALMGHPEWLDAFDDDWLEFSVTADKVAAFQRGFAAWVRGLAKTPPPTRPAPGRAAGAGQRRSGSAPFAAVPAPRLLPAGAAPRARRCGISHRAVRVQRITGSNHLCRTRSRPAHRRWCWTASILRGRRRRSSRHNSSRPGDPRGGPLEGVRVVELTKVWAGPYAGKLLALLGAEVIKVETASAPEEMRAYGGTDINHAPYFLSINPEILSVDLDIKSAEGMARLRELIARSDIVINNLRPARWSARAWGTSSSRRSSRTSSRCRSRCGATTDRWVIKPAMRHASPRWPGSRRWSATPVGLRSGRACATGIPRSARPPPTPPSSPCCIASSPAQANSSTCRPSKPCPR